MRLYAPRSVALTGQVEPPLMRMARNGTLFGLRGLVSIKMIDPILPHVQEAAAASGGGCILVMIPNRHLEGLLVDRIAVCVLNPRVVTDSSQVMEQT
jgi:hypothetical protein